MLCMLSFFWIMKDNRQRGIQNPKKTLIWSHFVVVAPPVKSMSNIVIWSIICKVILKWFCLRLVAEVTATISVLPPHILTSFFADSVAIEGLCLLAAHSPRTWAPITRTLDKGPRHRTCTQLPRPRTQHQGLSGKNQDPGKAGQAFPVWRQKESFECLCVCACVMRRYTGPVP